MIEFNQLSVRTKNFAIAEANRFGHRISRPDPTRDDIVRMLKAIDERVASGTHLKPSGLGVKTRGELEAWIKEALCD